MDVVWFWPDWFFWHNHVGNYRLQTNEMADSVSWLYKVSRRKELFEFAFFHSIFFLTWTKYSGLQIIWQYLDGMWENKKHSNSQFEYFFCNRNWTNVYKFETLGNFVLSKGMLKRFCCINWGFIFISV